MPDDGPAERKSRALAGLFKEERKQVAPKTRPDNGNWHPGSGPSQALLWAVESVAKAGTLAIIGVYPQTVQVFPIGAAMNKNLTVKDGQL